MTRSCGVLLLAVILLLGGRIAPAADVLTNDAIITMVKAGLGEEVIVGKIKVSQSQFDLSTRPVLNLKDQGVSDTIIKAMIETSAPGPPLRPKTPQEMAQETEDAIRLYQQGKVVEAISALEKLIAERPDDDELKIWKALALLEQARAMKDSNTSSYKPLVVQAYTILQPLGRKHYLTNADWNFAMAKAFWLNDRPTWAKRAVGKALDLRPNFVEPQLLLGDLTYDDEVSAVTTASRDPRGETARRFAGLASRKQYEKALTFPDLRPAHRAEALYKLGMVFAELENKKAAAREYWKSAMAADPVCRYGAMAQEKLKMVPAK